MNTPMTPRTRPNAGGATIAQALTGLSHNHHKFVDSTMSNLKEARVLPDSTRHHPIHIALFIEHATEQAETQGSHAAAIFYLLVKRGLDTLGRWEELTNHLGSLVTPTTPTECTHAQLFDRIHKVFCPPDQLILGLDKVLKGDWMESQQVTVRRMASSVVTLLRLVPAHGHRLLEIVRGVLEANALILGPTTLAVADHLLASVTQTTGVDSEENLRKDYANLLKKFKEWDCRSGVKSTSSTLIQLTMTPPPVWYNGTNPPGSMSGTRTPSSVPGTVAPPPYPAQGSLPYGGVHNLPNQVPPHQPWGTGGHQQNASTVHERPPMYLSGGVPAMLPGTVTATPMDPTDSLLKEIAAIREGNQTLHRSVQELMRQRIAIAAVDEGESPTKRPRYSNDTNREGPPPSPCKYCSEKHWHSACPKNPRQQQRSGGSEKRRTPITDITCFRCQTKGHYAQACTVDITKGTTPAPKMEPLPPTQTIRIVVNPSTGKEETFDQAAWDTYQSTKRLQTLMNGGTSG